MIQNFCESVIFTSEYPKCQINILINILSVSNETSLLSSVFNTEPMQQVSVIDERGAVIPPAGDEDTVDADHDHIRSNMYSLIQQGNDALQYAIEIAKTSESPRAFEVVGTLIKNLSDMNLQLLDSHEKKQKLKGKKEEQQPQKIVNNSVVFTGTTAEINKMLDQMKKEQ